MIIRQVDINTERSALITIYNCQVRSQVRKIENDAKGSLNPEQQNEIAAILSLNQDGYKLWRSAVIESKNYYKQTTSEAGVNTLWRKELLHTQDAPRCIGPNRRCDCVISISFPGQCSHDIANHDGNFVKERWSERYYRLEKLETSSVTCMQVEAEESDEQARQVANPLAQAVEEHNSIVDLGEGPFDLDEVPFHEEQEIPVQIGRELNYGFVVETSKLVGTNIFNHPQKDLLLGMLLKVNELALGGTVSSKTLEETVTSYSAAFTHSGARTEMFSGIRSLQNTSVHRGSSQGRPRTTRMKGNHETRTTTGTRKSAPSLMSSESASARACGFCKGTGHNFSTCSEISRLKASAYKKTHEKVQDMIDYLGNEARYRVEVLPPELSQQFRDDPTWNLRIWPKSASHIMLCNLYRDFRQANSSEADNIVAVQLFSAAGVGYEDGKVHYSEVKTVRTWLQKSKQGKGLVLTKLQTS
jgi:hypothetical protein